MPKRTRNVIQWLLDPAVRDLDDGWMFGRLAKLLGDQGVPLWRAATTLRGKQAELPVRRLLWQRGATGEEVSNEPLLDGQEQLEAQMIELDQEVSRFRLDAADAKSPFPHLQGLAADGGSELLVCRLPMSRGHRIFVYWISDRAGGFRDEDVELLTTVIPALSLRFELSCSYQAIDHVLSAYLGKRAGLRVREGETRRGHGDQIGAALWLCTLRGFGPLVDDRPMDRVLRLLDVYLECVAGPILEEQGEILEIAGDAVLAIFPSRRKEAQRSCQQALRAAQRAFAAAQELNADRLSSGGTPLAFRIALHLGVVTHGNVAAGNRLGFVVVGPAVNELRRVNAMCGQLGKPLLMTEAFARSVGDEAVPAGRHQLAETRNRAALFTLSAYARRG